MFEIGAQFFILLSGDHDDFDNDIYGEIRSQLEGEFPSSLLDKATTTTPSPPPIKNLEHFESSFATKQRMFDRFIAQEANKTVNDSRER